MKVLVVCSGTHGVLSPFIKEQMDSLMELGIEFSLFQISKKGLFGYLSQLGPLKRAIADYKPDIVHAHYGLSGLLANLQRSVPVVTTFHGNDINPINRIGHSKVKRNNYFSFLAMRLSAHNIFVSEDLLRTSKLNKRRSIIPCAVNTEVFFYIPKNDAKKEMNLIEDKKYILFSSTFTNSVKNFALARNAINAIGKDSIDIIELKGFTRKQVNLLLNAVDCALMTSLNEGSPQFIKEAMACNCPIVSTDVGDVKWVIGNSEGCHLTSFDPNDVADKIEMALNFSSKKGKTNTRERIFELGLDTTNIAKRIFEVYKQVLEKRL